MEISTGLNSQAPSGFRSPYRLLPFPQLTGHKGSKLQPGWLSRVGFSRASWGAGTPRLLLLQPFPPLWNIRILIFIETWLFEVSQLFPSQVTTFAATGGEGNISDHSKTPNRSLR